MSPFLPWHLRPQSVHPCGVPLQEPPNASETQVPLNSGPRLTSHEPSILQSYLQEPLGPVKPCPPPPRPHQRSQSPGRAVR